MSTFKKKMRARDASLKKKEVYSENTYPVFDEHGKLKKAPKRERKKWILVTSILLLIIAIIYVPALIYPKDKTENPFYITPDTTEIRHVQDYVKAHPNDDMDNDGVINSMESLNGTSPRRPDSDSDGLSDYAEGYITFTDPRKADKHLDKLMKEKLETEGKEINHPFKVGNIVLWADDLTSRTYGSVVKTLNGFRFCKFKGWVEFPVKGVVAYKYENGVHEKLEYKEDENAWKITGEYEVVLLDHDLEEVYKLKVFNKTKYFHNRFFGKIFTLFLPKNSFFLSCDKVMKEDTYVDTSDALINNIVKIEYLAEDDSRYGRNMNELTDLANIYASLEEGRCILANLISGASGITTYEIYGRDANGNLLIADPNSLEPLGAIFTEERAEQFMDKNGDIIVREWFEFTGGGFNSKNGDAINFFAVGRIPSDDNAIAEEPESTLIMAGNDAIFTIKTAGEVEGVHWLTEKEEAWVEIEENKTVNQEELIIPGDFALDGTKYKCVVTFKNGDTLDSTPVTLSIYGIKKNAENAKIKEGETAVFSIDAPHGKEYLWQISKDGKAWENIKDNKSAATNELKIKGTTGLNGNLLKCTVTFENDEKLESEGVTLTVEAVKKEETAQKGN